MSTNLPAMVGLQGQTVRKGRISPALATAVTLIVHEALTVAEAAQRTGYKTDSLAKALLKPHVRHYREGVKRAWLASKTQKAWLVVANLAQEAGSEKVQLDAAKTILQAAGELVPEGEEVAKAGALIQFIRNEIHHHGPEQPLSQRMPGVVQVEQYQDAEYEALDHDPSLTPGGGT